MKIALLGGTGDIGAGLAMRFAMLGHDVIVGSRKPDKAIEKCGEYAECVKGIKKDCKFYGTDNISAAKEADVSILTIPWKFAFDTAKQLKEALKGKIVVSPVVPMGKKGGCLMYTPTSDLSAAEEIANILKESRVVGAFQTVPAAKFSNLDAEFDWDVPVCSDDEEAKEVVIGLIKQLDGLRPLDAGPLSVSKMIEGITPLLVNVMARNKLKNIGVKFK